MGEQEGVQVGMQSMPVSKALWVLQLVQGLPTLQALAMKQDLLLSQRPPLPLALHKARWQLLSKGHASCCLLHAVNLHALLSAFTAPGSSLKLPAAAQVAVLVASSISCFLLQTYTLQPAAAAPLTVMQTAMMMCARRAIWNRSDAFMLSSRAWTEAPGIFSDQNVAALDIEGVRMQRLSISAVGYPPAAEGT